MKVVTILGAGVMGSSMCMPLVDAGMQVRLVGTHLDGMLIDSIKGNGLHPKLNVTMPEQVQVFHHYDFSKALGSDTDLVLLGVSSAGVGWAIERLCESLPAATPILMITKGMQPEADTMRSLPDVVADALQRQRGFNAPIAAIGGPCIAGELAVRRETGTVIVSRQADFAERLTRLLAGRYYFPRTSTDMMGVEVCAAFKNFFAIAVGWAHGRMDVLPDAQNKARNNNAAAVLFDQSVKELLALCSALGGKAESAWGMAGVGDLYVTCQAGRNSRLGLALGRGLTFAEAKEGPLKGETVEGAELGIAVATSIEGMLQSGSLNAADIPLTRALLATLTGNAPFEPPWPQLHRAM